MVRWLGGKVVRHLVFVGWKQLAKSVDRGRLEPRTMDKEYHAAAAENAERAIIFHWSESKQSSWPLPGRSHS